MTGLGAFPPGADCGIRSEDPGPVKGSERLKWSVCTALEAGADPTARGRVTSNPERRMVLEVEACAASPASNCPPRPLAAFVGQCNAVITTMAMSPVNPGAWQGVGGVSEQGTAEATTPVKVIASVTVLRPREVLLAKYRGFPDNQSGWFVPHDIVPISHDPDEIASTVLEKQFGIAGQHPTIHHIESFIGRDKSWHLCLHYQYSVQDEPLLVISPSIAEHQWFPLDQMPSAETVAHRGWALGIVNRVVSARTKQHHT